MAMAMAMANHRHRGLFKLFLCGTPIFCLNCSKFAIAIAIDGERQTIAITHRNGAIPHRNGEFCLNCSIFMGNGAINHKSDATEKKRWHPSISREWLIKSRLFRLLGGFQCRKKLWRCQIFKIPKIYLRNRVVKKSKISCTIFCYYSFSWEFIPNLKLDNRTWKIKKKINKIVLGIITNILLHSLNIRQGQLTAVLLLRFLEFDDDVSRFGHHILGQNNFDIAWLKFVGEFNVKSYWCKFH